MNSSFQLPTLDAAIPGTIVPTSGRQRAARLARCLLDAGLIRGRVSARRAANPIATSQHYLQAWLRERLGPLKCLQPGFRLHLSDPSGLVHETGPRTQEHAYFVWFSYIGGFAVGAALERLEEVQRGLGATVLGAIEDTSFGLVPVFTPVEALGVAQDYLWYGENDESFVLDERCGDDEAERSAMREEMVTRDKIDAAFPEWAIRWRTRRKLVGRQALRRIATAARGERVRRVAEDAMALLRLDLDARFRPEFEGSFVGYGAVLTWRRGDIAERIFDDYMNDASQGDAYDAIGEFSFALDDVKAAREWVDAMDVRFEGIRRLDSLIHTLSTGDWRRVPKGFK